MSLNPTRITLLRDAWATVKPILVAFLRARAFHDTWGPRGMPLSHADALYDDATVAPTNLDEREEVFDLEPGDPTGATDAQGNPVLGPSKPARGPSWRQFAAWLQARVDAGQVTASDQTTVTQFARRVAIRLVPVDGRTTAHPERAGWLAVLRLRARADGKRYKRRLVLGWAPESDDADFGEEAS